MCIGLQQNERSLLTIKAFYLRLSVSDARKPLPDSLTLHFLPRINGSPLYINDSRIRPDSPAFVTLHRVLSGERAAAGAAIFWSRELVRASEGVRFDVYLRDDKVLRGIFRRDDEGTGEWRMECKCVLEREIVAVEVTEAEVCVAVEGRAAAMSEKVKVAVRRKGRGKYCFQRLEEIPEQREVDNESDGCCCCCSKVGSNGGDFKEEESDADAGLDLDVDMDGLRWAVDVGIWVVCLGVGYLVSRASSRSLRGKRLL